ncbi:transmembrane 220 family protein [Maribacter aestuarii]|uniref:transmembrane 220 family protein n=1 Tax=Maribacter aestuarii TaxID=1130723 RepID=UPI00248B6F6F|nr:transmembrane 220 family protein [Maribacter aestuarii]
MQISTFDKILGFVFTGLFGLSAVLQYNDPDPILWIVIYTSAAVVSLLFAMNKINNKVPLLLGILCFIGFTYLYPSNFQGFDLNDGDIKTVELGREAFGLLIIALVFFWYALRLRGKLKI